MGLRAVPRDWSLAAELAGIGIGAAALMSAAWWLRSRSWPPGRSRLTERGRLREAPFRAVIDEVLAHVLLATLESVLVGATAAAGLMLSGWAARVGTALTGGLAAQIILLFVILVPRLYSAYSRPRTSAKARRLNPGLTRV